MTRKAEPSITIRIDRETATQLRTKGNGGETYDATLRRILGSAGHVSHTEEPLVTQTAVIDPIGKRGVSDDWDMTIEGKLPDGYGVVSIRIRDPKQVDMASEFLKKLFHGLVPAT